MNVPLVMTVIGPDRTGLVDLLAGIVAEHGGNWLESRMSHLGGHFAGILRVDIPAGNQPGLVKALGELQSQGLTVVAHTGQRTQPAPGAKLALMEIVGQDRPGIVREISRALAQHGVNVEELNTECGSAPMSGETIFKAEARVQIPNTCSTGELRKELQKIAQDLLVDVSFQELTP
jgi:glycine cleavage system regulatory protein